MKKAWISAVAIAAVAGWATANAMAAGTEKGGEGKTQTITGEVVDMNCFLDHGAKGEKHKGCAAKCIKNGGPVGLLSGDQVYLVVGEHQPINDQLANNAGQEVTLKGKVVERSGMKMIENAQLEK